MKTSSYSHRRIAVFESRRAEDMQRMIEKLEGIVHVSPSMREVLTDEDRPAIDFANRLITGQVDVVIFLTGVGTRMLVERIEKHVDRSRFLDALSDIKTIVRGPKPLAALKELGINPTIRVPEPNTWREVLNTIDESCHVANLVVAVQEYGLPNVSLVAGLEARGATVETVSIYRWALPEDTQPLEDNVQRLIAGDIDIAMFTSAQQLVHLLQIAERLEKRTELLEALRKVVIASIGPTTTEKLKEHSIGVDFEPSHPKMGHLVQETAEASADLIQAKQQALRMVLHAPPTEEGESQPAWHDSPFMRACRRESVPYTPIWLMRQAGRYMEEYRAVRAKTTFLELCKNPQLCSEVMCTAVEKLNVDAAIIFSDLLPILEPMGLDLEFVIGDGPKIGNPIREASDVERFMELENLESLQFVVETVSQTRKDLPENLPVIGFAGAPFTLASYAIEGGGSRSFLHTKTLMYREPEAWNELMQRLSRSIVRYLNAQIAAGAQAVQLFDSWVGCLGPDDYIKHVQPHVRAISEGLTPGIPLIHFGTGNPALLAPMTAAGGHVMGIDWRVDLAEAWQTVGHERAVQGNLDPLVLLADRETIAERAKEILDSIAGRPGHIFNLGHGVLQQTPVDNVRFLVDFVHEYGLKD